MLFGVGINSGSPTGIEYPTPLKQNHLYIFLHKANQQKEYNYPKPKCINFQQIYIFLSRHYKLFCMGPFQD